MNSRGVTLIELMIVVSIIGILIIALAFSYQGWQGRYKVEGEIKALQTDLMNARALATTRASVYFVDFPTTTRYRLSIDDYNVNYGDKLHGGDGIFQQQVDPAVTTPDTDTTQPTYPKTLEYPVTWAGGTVQFDQRGLITTAATPNTDTLCIFTDFDRDKTSDFNPDYDCIILGQTRITLGKLSKQNTDGGACDNANCVAK